MEFSAAIPPLNCKQSHYFVPVRILNRILSQKRNLYTWLRQIRTMLSAASIAATYAIPRQIIASLLYNHKHQHMHVSNFQLNWFSPFWFFSLPNLVKQIFLISYGFILFKFYFITFICETWAVVDLRGRMDETLSVKFSLFSWKFVRTISWRPYRFGTPLWEILGSPQIN